MGVIYKITNKVNGCVYIGKRQIAADKFIKSSYYGSGIYIRNAIKKYGLDKFTREIIDVSEDNKILCEKEKYWIKELNCKYPIGYNLTDGGDGGKGTVFSLERIAKCRELGKANIKSIEAMRQANLGRKRTPEQIEKVRKSRLGKKHTNKTKELISLANKSRSPEVREKQRQALLGRKLTQEQKEQKRNTMIKNGTSLKGKKRPKEVIDKLLKTGMDTRFGNKPPWNRGLKGKSGQIPWNKGVKTGPLPEETCKKMSESRKGRVPPTEGIKWSQDVIEKRRLGLKKAHSEGKFKDAYAKIVKTRRSNGSYTGRRKANKNLALSAL